MSKQDYFHQLKEIVSDFNDLIEYRNLDDSKAKEFLLNGIEAANKEFDKVKKRYDEKLKEIEDIRNEVWQLLNRANRKNLFLKHAFVPFNSDEFVSIERTGERLEDCLYLARISANKLKRELINPEGKLKKPGLKLFFLGIAITIITAFFYVDQFSGLTILNFVQMTADAINSVQGANISSIKTAFGLGIILALIIAGLLYWRHINLVKTNYSTLNNIWHEGSYWHKYAIGLKNDETEKKKGEIQQDYQKLKQEALDQYELGIKEINKKRRSLLESTGLVAAQWNSSLMENWELSSNRDTFPPSVLRIGELKSQRMIEETGKLAEGSLPALLPLISGRNVLIKTYGPANETAHQAVQSLLLRLLITFPIGKVNFTFIDPVGLGQNIAPFMLLGDYDEKLITSRAWNETHHIEQRLADLTVTMENVIQKYLKNEYSTIEAHNEKAGEVAEPYRILTVLNFPVNFSEQAARRLVSISQNGSRCGVYTIVTIEMDQLKKHQLYGFNPNDLEKNATVISWNGEKFIWEDDILRDCQLTLDVPPEKKHFNHLIKESGIAAKQASKVEVPFEKMFHIFRGQFQAHSEDYPGLKEVISPEDSRTWWSGHTRNDVVALLGRAGASKIQCLQFGKGDSTAHNGLVVGRVGSGKSTLLHILITSLALTYNPDELELYLIDFKKGVEFKNYAINQLPHARVIAIESEREFGLSVLQGLNTELERRGNLFREANDRFNTQAENITKFRALTKEPLPRILLVVDEFHEFFSEDDTLSSKAAQILDRLAREGRAFGIHILLASQTLTGIYTLSRSTIGQMATRIALQCNEADSRLILSDDNPAARLLTRPGEAIYNASNGLIEGNNLFQVAWLPDEKRNHYLEQLSVLAKQDNFQHRQQNQIIFEGNAPAKIIQNRLLLDLLNLPKWPIGTQIIYAWVGEPIAIKDHAAIHIRHRSSNNLLIIGQNSDDALSMMVASLLSLAAQHSTSSAKFYLLDFSSVDSPHADYFSNITKVIPHRIVYGQNRRKLSEIIEEIYEEVSHRLEEDETPLSEKKIIYLFVYGLQRARDLRQEEDFGFSFNPDENEKTKLSLPKQFQTILREGPELGVHTLIWCDTLNSFQRTLDRRLLREFALRVVLQMSAEDSVNLIDTPMANKIGPYRAILYSEDEDHLEKFRPYSLPEKDWLTWVKDKLHNKD